MKDKNGIEIKCDNCDADARGDCANWNPKNGIQGSEYCVNKYFLPSYKACEARITELQTELSVVTESEKVEAQEADRLREELQRLKEENLIRAVNSEVEIPKKELCLTDEELDLIRKYLQEQIWEYKDGWSAVKKIIAKCTELLKERNK